LALSKPGFTNHFNKRKDFNSATSTRVLLRPSHEGETPKQRIHRQGISSRDAETW
jgi:hypothetical protein